MEHRMLTSAKKLSKYILEEFLKPKPQRKTSQHSPFLKEQKNFFKRELEKMIKNQIKIMATTENFRKDLQDYNKENEHRILLMDEKEKLKQFRLNERNSHDQKYQAYLKLTQRKQEQIKRHRQLQKILLERKKRKRVRKEQVFKQKMEQREEQSLNKSLNYLENIEQKQGKRKIQTQKKKRLKTSQSVSPYTHQAKIKSEKQEIQEKERIKNFIKKLKKTEQVSLLLDIKKQGRKEKLHRSDSVKCLVKNRISKENDKMEKEEEKYKNRMSHFDLNHEKYQQSQMKQIFYRSFAKIQARKKVLRQKDALYENHIQNINEQMEAKKAKTENNSKNKLKKNQDLKNSRLLFKKNFSNLAHLRKYEKHEQNMRFLYRKINKIQQQLPNEVLTEKQKNILSQFLDERDKNYLNHKKFLEGSKKSFIQALQEQEESKKKLRKS